MNGDMNGLEILLKLKQEEYKPAVISRGYKRKSNNLVVVNDGANTIADVNSAGDEPYLIATKLNIPVVVSNEKDYGIEIIDIRVGRTELTGEVSNNVFFTISGSLTSRGILAICPSQSSGQIGSILR